MSDFHPGSVRYVSHVIPLKLTPSFASGIRLGALLPCTQAKSCLNDILTM